MCLHENNRSAEGYVRVRYEPLERGYAEFPRRPLLKLSEKGPLPAGGVKKPTAVATYSIVWPVSSSTNVSGGGSRSSVVQERQVEQPEASGSASMSISVIFPRTTATPITEKVGPPGARETIPATPFTSARRENRPRCEKARACSRGSRPSANRADPR